MPVNLLPVSEEFPPQAAGDNPDNQVNDAHHQTGFPPLAEGGVTRTENNRSGAGAVMSQ